MGPLGNATGYTRLIEQSQHKKNCAGDIEKMRRSSRTAAIHAAQLPAAGIGRDDHDGGLETTCGRCSRSTSRGLEHYGQTEQTFRQKIPQLTRTLSYSTYKKEKL